MEVGLVAEELEGLVASRTSKRVKSLTPPIQMELIRPGKCKVKVIANAVGNIPSKQMRKA